MRLSEIALALAVAANLILVTHAGIPGRFSQNMTVYHLNPLSAGALPVNMDTGDALGDLYFYLGQFLLPLECADPSPHSRAHFDCDNPERVSSDLVVTAVDLEYDTRTTGYSGCNLCNGTDPFTRKPCKAGTYICDCESSYGGGPQCDHTRVGKDNVTESFAPSKPSQQCSAAFDSQCGAYAGSEQLCWGCFDKKFAQLNGTCSRTDGERLCPNPWDKCRDGAPKEAWSCWASNIPRKTGGFWYSTLEEGQCTDQSEGCSWKAHKMTTINETCLRDTVVSSVEKHDGTGCFSACGARNMTSPCWIHCFFDTLLGPEASNSTWLPLGGMSVDAVEKTWTDAFLPVSQGGCPRIHGGPKE